MRKPLRVWMFYWVPAFAGKTNVGFLHSLCRRNDGCWFFAQSLKRRVQEILARHVLHAATLAGLDVLLGFCFRRKDGCWFFAQSLKRRVQEILARHVLHAATLAGLDVLLGSCFRRKDECWFFAQSLPQERRMLVFCTVSAAGMTDVGFLHSL